MPHVEQEQYPLPDHLSSPPVFSGVRVSRSLVVCAMFCISLVVPILLGIVLSVFRFMVSDYPLGIFKLFLNWNFVRNMILKRRRKEQWK
jgi:hypothetical protein